LGFHLITTSLITNYIVFGISDFLLEKEQYEEIFAFFDDIDSVTKRCFD